MKFDVKIKVNGEWHDEVIEAPDAVRASEIGRGWYLGATIVSTSVHEEKERCT